MHHSVFVTFILLVTRTFVKLQTADKNANAITKELFNYIAALPKQGKFLSGQFAGYSPDTFSMSQFVETAQITGKTPAILACDWACGWDFKDPPEDVIDYSCNPTLKDHWSKGGLVSVSMHLSNPAWPHAGGFNNKTYLNFDDLLKPESETGNRWRRYLDRIALGIDDLQKSNVTVLFRPFHEMNGDWFWWCSQDSTTFKLIWQDMFNYFTKMKSLHNVLWIYSPDQSRSSRTKYYPGDDFVDIVGLDAYTLNPFFIFGYEEMAAFDKPFAFAEIGPKTLDGHYDYAELINAIELKYHKVSYVLAWNDKWAPISNKNAKAYFNNPRTINLGDIHL